jgi:hypothetical protein
VQLVVTAAALFYSAVCLAMQEGNPSTNPSVLFSSPLPFVSSLFFASPSLSPRRCDMVDTRRSAAAKRPAAQQEEEGEKSLSPAPAPTDQAAGAGDGVAAVAQPAKRAKVRISPPPCARGRIGPGPPFGVLI